MSRHSCFFGTLALATALALGPAGAARAQDDWWEEEEEEPSAEEGEEESPDESEEEDDEDAEGEEDEDEDDADTEEDEEGDEAADNAPRMWHFGPWFRFVLVPAFIPQLFLDEAPTVAGPAFGVNATRRGESLNIVLGLGYTTYGFEDPFRAKGDPDTDTEWVESNLGLVHATASLLWDTEFSDLVALEYGFGADLGIVTGELRRTEAYPTGNGWAPCNDVLNPPVTSGFEPYCEPNPVAYDETGAHYDVVEERVPPIALVPMIPHLALRITPTNEWTVKAEMAYGIIQFWFGLSASYGPKL